jgi:hypothetical protein
MSDAFERAVKKRGDEGARRFAKWDAGLYHDLCDGQAKGLWKRLASKPKGAAVLDAYLMLAVEAIGLGYLDRAGFDRFSEGHEAANLITLFWLQKIPNKAFDGEPEVQIDRLVKAWNAGEGLLGASPWLNRYVTSSLRGLASIDELEAELMRVLEPALAAPAPSSFKGPFTISTIDAAQLDDRFLPGDMHLAAPAVLCVHDRKRDGVFAGVFLRPRGESSFLSLSPCLGVAPPEEGVPAITLQESRVRIGDNRVALPLLKRAHRAVAARAGFCVVSAVDSQRLWIVESP